MKKQLVTEALFKLIALDENMREKGFAWKSSQEILTQLTAETAEIQEAIEKNEPKERITEEIGDVIHVILSLISYTKCDLEEILNIHNYKIDCRFTALERIAKERGYTTLHGLPSETLTDLWIAAKKESPL